MGGAPALAAAGRVDWGRLGVLALLTVGAAGYAVLLALRLRLVARAGWEGLRAHPGPLLGVLCGAGAWALVVTFLGVAWSAGWGVANAHWTAHRWVSIVVIVCGFAFTFTDPGRRPRTPAARLRDANLRAHPRQALGGFVVGAAAWGLAPWGLAPLAAALPGLVGFAWTFGWPALMLGELGFGCWWWWRHGRFEEVVDGARTVYVPAYATHPAAWGWAWGTVATWLVWLLASQILSGR